MPMNLQVGRFRYPVRDFTHACQLACELRDASEMDSAAWSAAGPWKIMTDCNITLAHVSYNGRAWDRDINGPDWMHAQALCNAGLGYITPTRRIAQAERDIESAVSPGMRNHARRRLAEAYAALEALDAGASSVRVLYLTPNPKESAP